MFQVVDDLIQEDCIHKVANNINLYVGSNFTEDALRTGNVCLRQSNTKFNVRQKSFYPWLDQATN